jgi:hypothetical protein
MKNRVTTAPCGLRWRPDLRSGWRDGDILSARDRSVARRSLRGGAFGMAPIAVQTRASPYYDIVRCASAGFVTACGAGASPSRRVERRQPLRCVSCGIVGCCAVVSSRRHRAARRHGAVPPEIHKARPFRVVLAWRANCQRLSAGYATSRRGRRDLLARRERNECTRPAIP